MKTYVHGTDVLMLGLLTGFIAMQEPTGREVMELYKAQDRTRNISADETMTLVDARGRERERQFTYVTSTDTDDNRKMLIRFLAPADIAGTGFLAIEHSDREDDRWLYLPALRKSRRIAGSDKTDDFVGSGFTYEDLESEKLEFHQYTLMGSENVDGVETWVIDAVATDPQRLEDSGYSKRDLWITKDHHVLIRARYYDRAGAFVKELRATDVRQVPGSDKWRAYRMTMEDMRNGKVTILTVEEYGVDKDVPDSYFSERYLKRWR